MRPSSLLLGSLCLLGPVLACASPLGAEEQEAFIEAHDRVRASVTPAPAEPLPPMSWSEEAAAVASSWASRCRFEHNPDSGGRGENLAFFSTSLDSDPQMVVQAWADEAQHYDYATNTCAEGEVCGHYTQVVWRESTKVGCGVARCVVEGFEGDLWVCNYEPPGNFVGERPY